jgi:hypothetical protein
MARRKKSRKVQYRRRRRMSGTTSTGKNVLMTVAGIAGGAIIARVLSNTITNSPSGSKIKAGYIAAGQLVAGILVPKYLKSDLGKNLGAGMIAVGGLSLAQSTGIISGIGAAAEDFTVSMFSNSDRLQTIAGTDYGNSFSGIGAGSADLDVIAGIEEYAY